MTDTISYLKFHLLIEGLGKKRHYTAARKVDTLTANKILRRGQHKLELGNTWRLQLVVTTAEPDYFTRVGEDNLNGYEFLVDHLINFPNEYIYENATFKRCAPSS